MSTNEVPLPAPHIDEKRMKRSSTHHLQLTREEWLHVRGCGDCMELFVEIILEREEAA